MMERHYWTCELQQKFIVNVLYLTIRYKNDWFLNMIKTRLKFQVLVCFFFRFLLEIQLVFVYGINYSANHYEWYQSYEYPNKRYYFYLLDGEYHINCTNVKEKNYPSQTICYFINILNILKQIVHKIKKRKYCQKYTRMEKHGHHSCWNRFNFIEFLYKIFVNIILEIMDIVNHQSQNKHHSW